MITKLDKSHKKFSVDNCLYSACFQKSINFRSTLNVIIVFLLYHYLLTFERVQYDTLFEQI